MRRRRPCSRPDGRWVVTASLDGTARVWEAEGGVPVAALLAHQGMVFHAAFCPDGRHIVTDPGGAVRIWDIKPLGGKADLLPLWVQVATGTELDEAGELRGLTAQEWQRRREALREKEASAPELPAPDALAPPP